MMKPASRCSPSDHNVEDRRRRIWPSTTKIEAFAREHGADFIRRAWHRPSDHESKKATRGRVCIGGCIRFPFQHVWWNRAVSDADRAHPRGGDLGHGPNMVAGAAYCESHTTRQNASGVTGKDVIITLCGLFNNDEVLNMPWSSTVTAFRFFQSRERLTISNMTTEWGALAGVFPVDKQTLQWLRLRSLIVAKRGLRAFRRMPTPKTGCMCG